MVRLPVLAIQKTMVLLWKFESSYGISFIFNQSNMLFDKRFDIIVHDRCNILAAVDSTFFFLVNFQSYYELVKTSEVNN